MRSLWRSLTSHLEMFAELRDRRRNVNAHNGVGSASVELYTYIYVHVFFCLCMGCYGDCVPFLFLFFNVLCDPLHQAR